MNLFRNPCLLNRVGSTNYLDLNIVTPNKKLTTTSTTNTKKIVLAIEAAPASTPVNPNIPAIIAITKNINVHLNILIRFSYKMYYKTLSNNF